jgi:hypothetical protein
MAWQFSTNNTPATGAAAMFLILGRLIAAGWVVKSSSDGTTYNSSGNQISSGGSGGGGLANNSAWFRVQDPGTRREYVFQRGTSNPNWRVTYSPLAKFVTGSPSATQVPSASDSQTLLGAGTDASPSFSAFFGTDGAYRFSCAAQSVGTAVQPGGIGTAITAYPFFSVGWTIGAGASSQTHGMFIMSPDPVTSAVFNSGDTDPIFNYVGASSSSVFGSDIVGGSRVFGSVGGVAQNVTSSAPPNVNNWATDPSTAKDGALEILFVGVTAPIFAKGFAQDCYWGCTGSTAAPRPTGSVGSLVTTNDRLYINQCTVPWDGSNPTL